MMGVFCACCGGDDVIQDAKKPAAGSKQVPNRRKNSKDDAQLESHSAYSQPPSGLASKASDCSSQKYLQSEMGPQLNFMHSKTLKLLTEVGELNNFQHNTYETDKLRKDLQIHSDFLARLENPTQFT